MTLTKRTKHGDLSDSFSKCSRQSLGPRRTSGSFGRRLGSVVAAVTLFSVVFFGSAGQARAYTDPGSGALIWQMLVAGFVGAMFYFRRFTSWFRERRNGSKPQASVVQPDEQTELPSSEK